MQKQPQKLSMSLNVAKTAKDNIGTGAMEFVCAMSSQKEKKGYSFKDAVFAG